MNIILLLVLFQLTKAQFQCPRRCQCYRDFDNSPAMHLICKWEQLNSTNLDTLGRRDLVRTLTIRCPHLAREKSQPYAGIFNGLRNLDRLEIDRCIMDNIPQDLFAGLHQLYSLILRDSRLPELPPQLFAHLPNLMTLDLSGNRLRIEPYSLASLKNLIHLDLSNNSIAFVANTMISLTSLRVLTMDHNQLTNIDFRRLPEPLTDLSLRHNNINTVHYVPHSARHLRRLDLAGNSLDFIASFGSTNVLPPSIHAVDVSNNRITHVQEGAVGSSHENLVVFDLRNNSLTDLKESSLSGTKNRLRVFASGNPFDCSCSIAWMLTPGSKSSPTVVDADEVECRHITHSDRTLTLPHAVATNQLLCKYTDSCPATCNCCHLHNCDCRSVCPTGCTCFESSSNSTTKGFNNAIRCDAVRLDLVNEFPKSTTELRLRGVDWKEWKALVLNLTHLTSLTISHTPLTEQEANTLSLLPSLLEADLSSNKLKDVPVRLRKLRRLKVHDNPLDNAIDISMLDSIASITLGGNHSTFSCDCEEPSPLQEWLSLPENREKVEDLDDVMCYMALFGKVKITSTLPSNSSLCADVEDPTPFTKKLKTTENTMLEDNRSTSNMNGTIEESSKSPTSTKRTMVSTTTKRTPRTFTSRRTTTRAANRKHKYMEDKEEANKFINALIVILCIGVVVLVVAISVTLFKIEQAEEEECREAAPLKD